MQRQDSAETAPRQTAPPQPRRQTVVSGVTWANLEAGLSAGEKFPVLADEYLDDLALRHPDMATRLGDHRFDDSLPDGSAVARAEERRALDGFAARLAALDTGALTAELRVDAAMMADSVARRIFEIDELREHTWDPLAANPGEAIYQLLARDFAPLPDRLASVAARLARVPAVLAEARAQLENMPRVHIETAIGQFGGTIKLVSDQVDAASREVGPGVAAEIGKVRPAALEALDAHRDWLSARLSDGGHVGGHVGGRDGADGFADPRIGPERFARKLSLALSAEADSDAILARAEADLDRITEQITMLAAEMGGAPRQVLDRLAAAAPDERTILGLCVNALNAQTEFVRDHDLVTLFDDPIELIDMPEIHRGIAVAYCDSPGPLEEAPLPTFIAVSPVPGEWSGERKASFYREYNRHMVHNLMVHEAMPGHYLQLQHSRRFAEWTRLRAALRSGSFIEGWAVYAERLMADHGYRGEGDPRAVRMQQLKMQLRTTINAILDARVHAHGMTEGEAMALMTGRGFQEDGEAAGKWRRALLTSAQLSTYYVGYTEISDLAAELLAAAGRGRLAAGGPERTVHDRMLAHGSPPVRLLRTVV
jgi:uncharacterized protein (DUF885 family)